MTVPWNPPPYPDTFQTGKQLHANVHAGEQSMKNALIKCCVVKFYNIHDPYMQIYSL